MITNNIVTMHLFGRRCIVTTRREARQIQAAPTVRVRVRSPGLNISERRPCHHHRSRAPLRAVSLREGGPVNTLNYLPIFGSKRPTRYKPAEPHEEHASPRDHSLETSSESNFLAIYQRSRKYSREYSVSVERTRLSKIRCQDTGIESTRSPPSVLGSWI